MRSFALVALLASATSVARADTPGIDLTLHATEPNRLVDAVTSARHVRLAGIVLSLAGLTGAVLGGVGVYRVNPDGDGADNYTGFAKAMSGIVGGETLAGVGVGLAIYGDHEVKAYERGTPPRRSRGMRNAGNALTVLGGVAAAGAFAVAIQTTQCANQGDICVPLNLLGSATLGGVSSLLLGTGVPLLAIGVSNERRGHPLVTIDSMGPRSMPNGGGFGIGGRF